MLSTSWRQFKEATRSVSKEVPQNDQPTRNRATRLALSTNDAPNISKARRAGWLVRTVGAQEIGGFESETSRRFLCCQPN